MGGISESQLMADFYRQLSLLVKSGMPLPDSILALKSGMRKRAFRESISAIASSISSGASLAAAMRKHPQFFPGHHVKMIETSEGSGMLAETLEELAAQSLLERETLLGLRQATIFPLLSIYFGALLCLGVLNFTIPQIADTFYGLQSEIGDGGSLPFLTRLVLSLPDTISANRIPVVMIMFVLIPVLLMLLSGFQPFYSVILREMRKMPIAAGGFRALAWARSASAMSLMIRRGATIDESLLVASGVSGCGKVAAAFKEVRELCDKGLSPADSFVKSSVPDLFKAAFARGANGGDLAGELSGIAEIQLHLGRTLLARWAFVVEVLTFVFCTFFMALMIISMFAPFVMIIEKLGL